MEFALACPASHDPDPLVLIIMHISRWFRARRCRKARFVVTREKFDSIRAWENISVSQVARRMITSAFGLDRVRPPGLLA